MLYIRYVLGKNKPIFICQGIDIKYFLILKIGQESACKSDQKKRHSGNDLSRNMNSGLLRRRPCEGGPKRRNKSV